MPPRKKQKTSKTGQKAQTAVATRRAGQSQPPQAPLARLLDLALEVQDEIYGWLEPLDLFHLSQTGKMFDQYLRHNSKARMLIWKKALENVHDLPPRPPFMDPRTFVRYLYESHCENCGRAQVYAPIVAWFRRYCATCFQVLTYDFAQALDYLAQNALDRRLNMCFPRKFKELLLVHQPHDDLAQRGYNRIHKKHLAALIEEWRALGPASHGTKRLTSLLQARAPKRLELVTAADQCRPWFAQRAEQWEAERKAAQDKRYDELSKRLKRMKRWKKEIEFLGRAGIESMSDLPIVCRVETWTKDAWKEVYAKLEPELKMARQMRLDEERKPVLAARFRALDVAIRDHYTQIPHTVHMEYRPRSIDFAFTKKCKSLLTAPTSRTVTTADFSPLVPALAAAWEASLTEKLAEIFRNVLPFAVPADVDVFTLAVAFFGCQCSVEQRIAGNNRVDPLDAMRYPAILGHCCLRNYNLIDDLPHSDAYSQAAMEVPIEWQEMHNMSHDQQAPSSVTNVSFTLDVVREACAVVSALGLDPERATFEDLRQCDAIRLRCVKCTDGGAGDGKVRAYTWEAALRHANGYADNMSTNLRHSEWARIGVEHMTVIGDLEAVSSAHTHSRMMDEVDRYHMQIWACSLCADCYLPGPIMKDHLNLHGFDNPDKCIKNGTVYLHPYDRSTARPLKEAVELPPSS